MRNNIVQNRDKAPQKTKEDTIYLADEPFHTFQGEGPYTGYPAIFIRFWGCNFHCNWCDTKYSWQTTKDRTPYTYESILEHIDKYPEALVILTGGEPILQKNTIARLCSDRSDRQFQVETNGSLPIDSLVNFDNLVFIVSPKLASSGNSYIYKKEVVDVYDKKVGTSFKFVATKHTFLEIEKFVLEQRITSPIYIMPEGRSSEEVIKHTREIWDWALLKGFRMTSRLHVLAFGNKRSI